MLASTDTKKRDDYGIGLIVALSIERAAVTVMLDERYDEPEDFVQTHTDSNAYTWGRMGKHNIVITSLPESFYGIASAADTASKLLTSFPQIKFGLLVGIGAGLPNDFNRIRLGDVVVSRPTGDSGGVLQYDLGKALQDDVWEPIGTLAPPPQVLLRALSKLRSEHEINDSLIPQYLKLAEQRSPKWAQAYSRPPDNTDRLLESQVATTLEHKGIQTQTKFQEPTSPHQPQPNPIAIHYGVIASGNTVVKDETQRIKLLSKLRQKCICLEMEAAGLMNTFPCIVIRGICDYADSQKNDLWQKYAAATAAAFTKELLHHVPVVDIKRATRASDSTELIRSEVDKIKTQLECERLERRVKYVLQLLYTCAYTEHKNRNIKRIPGTCEWFTGHSRFTQWHKSEDSCVLWVSADPGSGKSVLARYLIDEVLPRPDTSICYFFFRDDYVDQRRIGDAICALLHQLFIQQPSLVSHDNIKRIENHSQHLRESVPILWQILIEAIASQSSNSVIIVMDALDECKDIDQLESMIHSITNTNAFQRGVKFLLTSRPYDKIRRMIQRPLSKTLVIHLSGEDELEVERITQEISLVVKHRIEQIGIEKSLQPDEISFLQLQFSLIPNRTYLWVHLTLDIIRNTPGFSKGNVKETISKLPTTVDEAYEKILSRSADKTKARRLLMVVLAAHKPLSVMEVGVAFSILEKHKSWECLKQDMDSPQRMWSTMRALCGLFIIVNDSKVYLLHQTAREFLTALDEVSTQDNDIESAQSGPKHLTSQKRSRDAQWHWKHSITSRSAHRLMAGAAIQLLKLEGFNAIPTTWKAYFAQNWMSHFNAADIHRRDSLCQSACVLLRQPMQQNWMPIWVDQYHNSRVPRQPTTPLILAVYFRLTQVVEILLNQGAPINYRDDDGHTALWWAVHREYNTGWQLLFRFGA